MLGTLKKCVTGNGSVDKDELIGATVRKSRDLDIVINNEVDALASHWSFHDWPTSRSTARCPVADLSTLDKVRRRDRPTALLARNR